MAGRGAKSVGMVAVLILGAALGWYFLLGPGAARGEFGTETVVIDPSDGFVDVTRELMDEAGIGDSEHEDDNGFGNETVVIDPARRSEAFEGVTQRREHAETEDIQRYEIVAGQRELAVSQRVSGSGGRIVVDESGLMIDVPAGSFRREVHFEVWKSPVERFDGPVNATPVSSLIHVENGGAYSDEPMKITFPLRVPEGHFAMPFFYDPETGELDGLPVIASDANGLTAVTRHFSLVLVLQMALVDFEDRVDSTFKVKRDSWHFPNPGVWYSPDGLCSGMSLGAVWYFRNRTRLGKGRLYMLADTGLPFKTPGYPWDDAHALRFVSTIQVRDDQMSDTGMGEQEAALANNKKLYYLNCWRSFLMCLSLTKQPQYCAVFNSGQGAVGHAIVVWGASVPDRRLYVYDPNFPKATDRYIQFTEDGVAPFVSASNSEKYSVDALEFTQVHHLLGSAMISSGDMERAWRKSASGINGIPGDMGYELWVTSEDGKEIPLSDGYTTNAEALSVRIDGLPGQGLQFDVYTVNGAKLPAPGVAATVIGMGDAYKGSDSTWAASPVPLREGENVLGFLIEARKKDMEGVVAHRWVDFRWVRVNRASMQIVPETQNVGVGMPCSFRAQMLGQEVPSSYLWNVPGQAKRQASTNAEATMSFDQVGQYPVSVEATLEDGSTVTAKASVTVGDVNISVTSGLPVVEKVKARYKVVLRNAPNVGWEYRWHFPGRSAATTQKSAVKYTFNSSGMMEVRVEAIEAATGKVWGSGTLHVFVTAATPAPNRPDVDWTRVERDEVEQIQDSVREIPGDNRTINTNLSSADARRLQQERTALKNKLDSLISQGRAESSEANQVLNRIEQIDALLWQ